MNETASLGIKLNQLIQNLKLEILQISGECRLLFAHRAKITFVINYIHELFKQLSISSNDQRIASPSEEIHFRQLIYVLCDIRAIINNYITEQNFIQFVLNQSLDDIEKSLMELKKEFDDNFSALIGKKIDSLDVSFDDDEYTECKFEDYRVLNQRLENLTLDSKASANKRTELIEVINERLANSVKPIHDKKKQIYTDEEIKKTLKKFQKYQINRDDYITLGTKHYGSYSKVYTGISKKNGKIVAIKVLNGFFPSELEFEHFKEYLSFFIALKHPSILSFVGFSYDPLPLLSITNDMPGGSLSERLHDKFKQLDPTKQTIIALGIARGMQFLHHKGYIHRDLNSSSILLDEDDHPFISDFKLMAHKDKDNLAIQQITSWTAPEMMIGGNYNQKADVYSFGIILWEILTREVPFRGLSPFAIAHEVCESDSRPLIPQNCPPKLAKLIQVCWHKDPRKRPDFNAIVYSFESGKIAFLGTSSGPVIAYSRLFKEIDDQIDFSKDDDSSSGEPSTESQENANHNTNDSSRRSSNSFKGRHSDEFQMIDDDNIATQQKIEAAIKKYDSYTIDQIISNLTTDPMTLVNLLSRDLKKSDIKKIMTAKTFSKSLIRCSEVCEWPDFINNLTTLFYRAINEKIFENNDIFKNSPYLSIFMKLFKKFGSTRVTHFVDVITSLFNHESNFKFTFSLECFKSLSPFLISSEFEIRKKITSFLIKLFEQNAYDKTYSLIPIIPNLLENLKAEMLDDHLILSLKLCDSLCSFSAPLKFMIEVDAANIIVPLCLSSNDQVSSQAMHLINKILNRSQPSENFIQNYLSKFANFHFDPSSSQALEPLVVLTHFLKTPEFVCLFIDNNEAISTFSSYLESKDETVLAFALRLTFSFISLSKTPSNFSVLCKQLIRCLSNENKKISMMASACLTSIVPSVDDNFMNDSLANYFKVSLSRNDGESSESEGSKDEEEEEEEDEYEDDEIDHYEFDDDETRKVCVCALKLAGALTLTFDGALFLHENNIVELIISFLNYKYYRSLALSVLASQSSQIPSSMAMANATSTVIIILKKLYKNEMKTKKDEGSKEEEDTNKQQLQHLMQQQQQLLNKLEADEMKIEEKKMKLISLNFISNVMTFPKAASIAAHKIIDILEFANNDDDSRVKQQIVKILYVIVSSHETRELIEYKKMILMITKTLLPLLDIENTAFEAYKTLDILSTLKIGSEVLMKYIEVFKEKLTFMTTQMIERNPCVRLIARLSHCD